MSSGTVFVIFQIDPNSHAIGPLITCLRRGRVLGIVKSPASLMSLGDTLHLWNGIVPVAILQRALCHQDDQASSFTNLILGHKMLNICFSGTVRITFNPRIKKFYCISTVHIEKSSIHRELSV